MDNSTINLIIGGAIGVLGTLFGTIVTGFFNRANLKMQLQQAQSFENQKQRKRDLEDLYNLISSYNSNATSFATELLLLKRDLESQETKEKFSVIGNNLLFPLAIIHTKVMIHTKDLENQFNNLNESAYQLMEAGLDFLKNKINYPSVTQKHRIINTECKKFFKSLEDKIIQLESNLNIQSK